MFVKKALRPATAPKKAVNLSLDSELLRPGKELGLNLSSLAEEALARAVKAKLAQRWLEENAGAIGAHDQRVEARGVFSDGLRTF
jgi:antitoxin CcdA